MTASADHVLRARFARMLSLTLGVLAVGFGLAAPAFAADANDFGVSAFTSDFRDPSGATVTQAGAHADQVTDLQFSTDSNQVMNGSVRNIEVDLPAGFYGNPQVMATCKMEDILIKDGVCYPAAQVGILTTDQQGFLTDYPVYNLAAPDSQTAVLGVVVIGVPAKIVVSVRSGSDFGLTAKVLNANQAIALDHTRLTLWGVPADPIHDAQRYSAFQVTGASAGVAPRPFLSMPARCGPVTTTVRAASWQNPNVWSTRSYTPPPLTGCDLLSFDATIKARPQVTTAGAPSGFDVDVNVPQDQSVMGLATPTLRKAVVTLPAGTRVSPGSAEGLGACSDAEMKVGTDAEPSCPDSSKVGTVTIDTPVLAKPPTGDIILGTQRSDQLLRLWFVVRGPGLLLKIPGKVDPDPVTGQLVATFDGTPQLPFTTLSTTFKGGPRAALVNPKTCGRYTTHATLTPWSGGPAVEAEDSFTIDSNCDQAGKFEPTMDAGVTDARAAASSTFVLNLSRPSGQQDIASVDTVLPPGLLADIGSVPLCPEAGAAVGDCPAASQVGRVTAGVGAGPSPLAVPQPGKAPTAVYLSGPYKGAPYSASIVVPAQAGPFDLGTVVVRAAVYVDPVDAHVTVKADPLPLILQGIPLDMQKIGVSVDRPEFMLNPTNCRPMQIDGQIGSSAGASVAVHSPFTATNCQTLGLAPKIGIALSGKGQTTDGKHPSLRAVVTQQAGESNLKKVTVTLPLSLALDPDNAQALCEFTDGSKIEPTCPKGSIVGTATAQTPILNEPLTGPVYFVKNVRIDPKSGRQIRTLPKLVIPLTGPNGVRVNLVGTSSVPDGKHLVTTFENVPDAPVSSFTMNITGGAHGILVVSNADICKAKQTAVQQIDGQNGKTNEADITLKTPLCSLKVVKSSHTKKAVRLTVSGIGTGGRLTASGKSITKASRTVTNTGTATVSARLTSKAGALLARGRNITTRVAIAYTPAGTHRAKTIHKTITIHAR